jgi:NAD(P)H dehydrogenase (quinone)
MADLLVTGASGKLGRLVLDHLLDTLSVPAGRVAAATRSPGDLAAYAARGVEARRANFDDPALPEAFAGIDRLLIISTNAIDDKGTRRRQQEAAVRAAAAAGVRHVVYTSLPYADRSPILFAPDHLGTEKAIEASGVPGWTVLRNNWYFENLLLSLPPALASGKWYSAGGDGPIAYIARADLALAAATALASDFDGQRVLTLSGDQSLTTPEVARMASEATGKPLEVVQVEPDGLVQGMLGAGLPEAAARTFASFDDAQKAGLLDGDATDFEALARRKPARLADWIRENAAALAG